MAYENDILTRNDDDELSVRVVQSTGDNPAVAYDDVYTRDDNGKLAVRVVGAGGGGSDTHNLGYYADLTALQTAHPTGTDGDFAILGSTDTIWVWDSGTSAWKDTDTKGQVTSVNNQTGAVTVQETLVSGTNIKTIDGNSVLGSGNLELSTYLTYPAGWTTNSTTKAFCDSIAADTTATVGKAYLGEVTCSDLPAGILNAEVVVEIMDGTTAQDKVIVLSLKSGNVAPYAWQYVYWDNGTNVSGWKTWQEPLVSGTNIKTINGTSLLGSGDIATEAIQVSTMPTAAVGELGKIYQFVGTTDANYTNGYFYKCVSDGENPATYSWTQINVQPSATKHKYTVTLEMVQGETMTTAFYMRGAEGKTTNLNITQFISYEEGGVWDDPYFDGQYIGFLKSGADGISASKIIALNTETVNLGFDVYATDDNDEPIIEFVADYAPSYVTQDSVKVIFEIESDEPLVEVETSEAGEYLGEICITQAVPYLSLSAPSGADQDYVLQNTNGERISWVAAPTGLPSQTGNSGKFLTTDGTDASWATVDAIQVSTMPTAAVGELGKVYQFIGTTDANYTHGYFYECVSDGATPPVYSWTQTNVQPAGSSLPSQTGNSGKFLTTNGTDPSWATINALQNTATSANSLTILGNVSTVGQDNLNIGQSSTVEGPRATAVGVSARSWYPDATALGYIARADKEKATAIGAGANVSVNGTGLYGVAIGYSATVTAESAIQIGGNGRTNSESGTLCIGSGNNNYKLLDSNGTIPADRLPNAINKYSSMPTAASTNLGWIVQYTGATDSTYTHGYIYECVSDGGNPATYSWSAVSVQAGGGSSLPSQTGNAGKVLMTDGTDASWATVNALQNTATGTESLTILGTATNQMWAVNLGSDSRCQAGLSVAVGRSTKADAPGTVVVGAGSSATQNDAVAIGQSTNATGRSGIAIGSNTSVTQNTAIAIGTYTYATATNAIQLGANGTNSEAGTFCVASKYNNTNVNYKMMDADGTIPTDRYTTTPSADGTYVPTLTISSGVATRTWAAPSGGGSTALSLTLAAANWSNNTITVTATGVTASNNVIVSPAPASQSAYTTAGVICTAQATDSLTFTCTTTPSSDLTVTVLII